MIKALVLRHGRWLAGFLLVFTFCRWPTLEGWDEAFYFAQLTSAVGDGDLVLQNDLFAFPNPPAERLRTLRAIRADGALSNTFSIGPAVVHAAYTWPLFAIRPKPVALLRAAIALGSVAFLMILVLAIQSLLARAGYAPRIADLASVLAVVAGPLALYATRASFGSHLLSALFGASLVLALARWLECPSMARAALLGTVAGVLVIARWQDALFVTALAVAGLAVAKALTAAHRRTLPLAGPPFALAVCCQLLAWRAQFGTALLVPQGEGYMRWTDPSLAAFLFSAYHGLVPWTPAFAMGVATAALGVGAGSPLARLVRIGFPLAAAATVYASASVTDWWGGASYGPRRLSSLTVVAAFGLAWVLSRCGWRLRAAIAVAICAWAVFTVTAYLSGFDDLRVLLQGRLDPFNSRGLSSYEGARWIDRGLVWPLVLRPGFKLADAPQIVDRIVGMAAVLAVYGFVVAVWRRVGRWKNGDRTLAAAAAAWLAVCAAWLAFVVPSNRDTNRIWRTVVDGAEPSEPLPPSLESAAHLVAAAQALERGDEAAFARHAPLVGRDGPSPDALRRAVRRVGEP